MATQKTMIDLDILPSSLRAECLRAPWEYPLQVANEAVDVVIETDDPTSFRVDRRPLGYESS